MEKLTTCADVPRKEARVTNSESPAIERSAAIKCVALLNGSFETSLSVINSTISCAGITGYNAINYSYDSTIKNNRICSSCPAVRARISLFVVWNIAGNESRIMDFMGAGMGKRHIRTWRGKSCFNQRLV